MGAKIITIAIEKGGSGKTVTASNLAYLMGDEGKKVLCVDTGKPDVCSFGWKQYYEWYLSRKSVI